MGRVSKLWSKHNLPEDLWPEILSRLPVKSLLQFRSVCKSFKLFIDDPEFTRLHFNRFKISNEPFNLFFILGIRTPECVVKNHTSLRTNLSLGFLQSDFGSENVLRTTPARRGVDPPVSMYWAVVSSIDGLFLLQSSRSSDFMIWNPSIRKTLVLPQLPDLPQYTKYVDFGLGFDPLLKDYKFVRFASIEEIGMQFIAIYTLATNSWKVVVYQGEDAKDLIVVHNRSKCVSCNGVVYAVGANDDNDDAFKLVSFDLRSESFAFFKFPGSEECVHSLTLVDDGSSLAVVNMSEVDGSIWVLERLEDDIEAKSWSWSQRYTFATTPKYEFMWLKKNGEMLIKSDNKVICYNLETKEEKVMLEKNRKKIQVSKTVEYMESLVLLS